MSRDLELGQFRIFEKRSPIDYRQSGIPWLNDSLLMAEATFEQPYDRTGD
jgi:hypothetical protein